jgi:hypothetical protein
VVWFVGVGVESLYGVFEGDVSFWIGLGIKCCL